MAEVSVLSKGDECMELPPGFRFHPTDEEIITHYLSQKVMNSSFSARAVCEVDLNKCEPWDLPGKAKMGEKEWYFFCQRDRKYPTGMRTNRATEAGYWKATGKDKEIYKGKGMSLVGMKKTLVFYRGRAPKGEKTNWVMHEYRLQGKFSYENHPIAAAPKDEWVVCRVFHKNTGGVKTSPSISAGLLRMNSFSFVDDLLLDSPSLPPLLDFPNYLINTTSRSDGENVLNNAVSATLTASDSACHFGRLLGHHDHPSEEYVQDHKRSFHHDQQYQGQGNPTPNSIYYPPHNQISPGQQNPPNFSFPGSSKSSWLHQDRQDGDNIYNTTMITTMIPRFLHGPDQAIVRALPATNNTSPGLKKQCKVEHFSSVVSKLDDVGTNNGSYDEDIDGRGPSTAAAAVEDLVDCLWNY